MAKMTKAEISEMVDALGVQLAQIAPMLDQIEAKKAKLKKQGLGRHYGVFFEVNIFEVPTTRFDKTAAMLENAEFVAKYMVPGKAKTSLTVDARKSALANLKAA